MKERPILFSGAMVRAILDGRKTQTRRVVKPQPHDAWTNVEFVDGIAVFSTLGAKGFGVHTCPYGQPGDHLWVRETWNIQTIDGAERVAYRADIPNGHSFINWRPSIFMPRWASRILLEVVSVRVERVRDISEEDAIAEGVIADDPINAYADLWDSINEKRGHGWDVNPWVWVVEFPKVQQ